MVALSIPDRQTTLTTSPCTQGLAAEQEVRPAQVPIVIRQAIAHLFASSGTDYNRIFEHLLSYATLAQHFHEEEGKVAVMSIPNQWKLYKSDARWPCCYATLNTFIRILCALGILRKLPGRKEQATRYLLPLTNFAFHADAWTALERLIDPIQTKNPKVRRLAEKVKRRFALFCSARPQPTPVQTEMGDSVLQTALTAMQQLVLHLLPGMEHGKKQQLMIQLSQIMVHLYTARTPQSGSFSGSVDSLVALSPPQQPSTDTWHADESAAGDSGKALGDSAGNSCAKGKKKSVDSAALGDSPQALMTKPQATSGDGGAPESPPDTHEQAAQVDSTSQNLPCSRTKRRPQGDLGQHRFQNLPRDGSWVASDGLNDNERNLSLIYLSAEKLSDIDATAATTAGAPRQVASYRPLAAGEAQRLARFIEGHDGNFRSFIALSTKYHPQVLRAAILNMLAHSFFPDLGGELPGEVDGELTGKVGRPKKPGVWVTACCQAYAEHGIPPVMHLLLQRYSGPYSVVQQQLEARSHKLSPVQFWRSWQEQLLAQHSAHVPLNQAEQPPVRVPEGPRRPGMAQVQTVHTGMTSTEAQQLVAQINRDGCAYHMQARPRLQDGGWEVEVEIPFERQPFTYPFRSRAAWEIYFQTIRALHA